MLAFVIGQIDMATAPDTDAVLPVTGSVQEGTEAAFGEGWYPPESGSDGADTWRWASSPATIWIYSPQTQTVSLRGTPIALHDPASPDGKGSSGSMAVRLNGRELGAWEAAVGAPLVIPLELQPGWSQVRLDLAAGSFKPIDVQPETGDGRLLSFALENLEIATQ